MIFGPFQTKLNWKVEKVRALRDKGSIFSQKFHINKNRIFKKSNSKIDDINTLGSTFGNVNDVIIRMNNFG